MPAGLGWLKRTFKTDVNLKSTAAEKKGEHRYGGEGPKEEQWVNVKQQVKKSVWLKISVAEQDVLACDARNEPHF